jgi:hypothetical protein
MEIEIAEWSRADLAAYARISIAFEVARVYKVTASGEGPSRFRLIAWPVAKPWVLWHKDLT